MVSPEEQGVFGMADRTHPWPEGVPHVSPPPERVQEKEKPSWIRRLANNLALRVGLGLLTIGGTIYGADKVYEDVPAIHQAVDSLLHREDSPEVTVPTDPILLSGVESGSFSGSNLTQIGLEQIKNLPDFDEKGNLLLLFPISNLAPGESIYYEKALDRTTIWPQEILQNALRENTKDIMIMEALANKEFRAPMDGRAFIDYAKRNQETIPVGIGIAFMGTDNMLYVLGITTDFIGVENIPRALDIIVPAPISGIDNRNGKDWEKGMLVERGKTTLFKTNQNVRIIMNLWKYVNGNWESHPLPGNIAFQTDPFNPSNTLAPK